ncbi:hypothetical protein Hanom_Chr04g00300781 [Helianthus anomalus]
MFIFLALNNNDCSTCHINATVGHCSTRRTNFRAIRCRVIDGHRHLCRKVWECSFELQYLNSLADRWPQTPVRV